MRSAGGWRRLVLGVASVLSGWGPATATPALPPGEAGTTAWQKHRAELASVREGFDLGRPYSLNVTLELWVERLGTRTRGRGAVAVHPPHGIRMIMLGPGGTTAMDLWICRDKFRFAVPAVDLVRRGDASSPPEEVRGLPVDFLRWWFLEPLQGRLLAAFNEPAHQRFLLKDRDSVVDMSLATGASESRSLMVTRRSHGDEERIETTTDLCGHVHYNQSSTSIDLDVTCEKVNKGTPPARAFADPDDPQIPCIVEEP